MVIATPEVGLVPILLFLEGILHCNSQLPQPGSELFFTTRHYHLLAIPLAMILCRTMNKKPHQGERVTLAGSVEFGIAPCVLCQLPYSNRRVGQWLANGLDFNDLFANFNGVDSADYFAITPESVLA